MATRQEREERKAEILKSINMVALAGSEKQISWASKIRESKIDYIAQCLAVSQLGGARFCSEAEFEQRVLNRLSTIADSSWWIQVRDCTDLDNPLFWENERTHKLDSGK